MIHTDHFANELSADGGDAIAYPMLLDGMLTLGYLRVLQTTDAELVGVDLAGEPASIPADTPFAIVRGLDEKRPRSRRVHYR